MKIKDSYEKNQVSAGYHNVEKCLFETRTQVSGAIFRTNFGDSGSQELQEAHHIFKEVDALLCKAIQKLKDIENMI